MEKVLGINGFGRIGKLTLWNQIGRTDFERIVVNIGREVGRGIDDIVHSIMRDSTYPGFTQYLRGFLSEEIIPEIDESKNMAIIDGVPIHFLQEIRNPAKIPWRDFNTRIVLDATGQFLDPTLPPDYPGGSIRGHLTAGAEKVIVSAPFKIGDPAGKMPEDVITTVMGINGNDYDPNQHDIISNASCTTTGLAHMMKPLLDYFGADAILTASMSTIHAATGSQQVLDRLPKAGKSDLRKNRGIMNNIILTSTGAAKALALVIPEMKKVGFIAESVRIPTTTGSLIILVVNFQEEHLQKGQIRRETINAIYKEKAFGDSHRYLRYSDKQNVSCDIIGPRAAVLIEGHETHTRTAEMPIDLSQIPEVRQYIPEELKRIRVPMTQAVIYGWYDNELGSYVNMLGDRIASIDETL